MEQLSSRPMTIDVGARAASRAARLGWAILALLPAAVIATAAVLTPDPAGHGTHVQLGLPPCGFLVLTGYPCPGCGLTTCFAHMVRLQIPEAVHANAFGVPLFLVSFFTIPVALVGFLRALPILPTLERFQFEKVAILLAVSSIAVWIARIATLLALR